MEATSVRTQTLGRILIRSVLAIAAALTVAGCQTPGLMATPNLYADGLREPFKSVPEPLQNNVAQVLYVTDRNPEYDENNVLYYGYKRSNSLAFGTADVQFGENIPWDTLVTESMSATRTEKLTPVITNVREISRVAASNERLEYVDGKSRVKESVLVEDDKKLKQFHAYITERLQYSEQKEVYLFIHGYNNDFNAAVRTIGELWHFMGRAGVPIAYTWPAGRGGVRGYTVDRESGEFTIFHLKQCLRALAACPSVERVNIIAHSRGTDVAMTALRELHLENKGSGKVTRTELKLGTVILAAPDLDFEVVTQRFGAEGVNAVPERLVLYISPEDKAIGVSTWLFDSVRRLGKLRLSDLSEQQRLNSRSFGHLEVIDTNVEKIDFFGHSYFYQSPAVSSDLILVLRENRAPGAEFGRPLTNEGENFWRLDNGYPLLESVDAKKQSKK